MGRTNGAKGQFESERRPVRITNTRYVFGGVSGDLVFLIINPCSKILIIFCVKYIVLFFSPDHPRPGKIDHGSK